MKTWLRLKRSSLDRLLQGLPQGALVLQACHTTLQHPLDGVAEALRIEYIERDQIGSPRPKRQSIFVRLSECPQHIEAFPQGGVITAIGGIYSFPELPHWIAGEVPQGVGVANVERLPLAPGGVQADPWVGAVRVHTRSPADVWAKFDLYVRADDPAKAQKLQDLALCRQWRRLEGVEFEVSVA